MAFLDLFKRRSDKQPEEQKPTQAPAAAEAVQPAAAAPAAVRVTKDMIVESIENCKIALGNCGLSEEEVDKYSAAFIAMQQAVRGLHANLDVTDLMEYLYQVFSSAMIMIFNGGTTIDRKKAMMTASDAIKAIASTTESPVKIATLQLAIQIQTASILMSRRTIADLNEEKAEYVEAEKELLRESDTRDVDKLSELARLTFDQYEQQINGITEQVQGAERLISTYNQEIASLKATINAIKLNPGALNVLASQEKMRELREKMSSMVDFIAMVEKATRNAEETRARTKAQIRELKRKLENTVFIPDPETEARMREVMAAIQNEEQNDAVQEAPLQTEEAEATEETEETATAEALQEETL